ncbi:hypothetical protein HN51_031459 [Arachis hypogaea]
MVIENEIPPEFLNTLLNMAPSQEEERIRLGNLLSIELNHFRMYGVALELDSHQIMLLLLWIVWWQGRMLLQKGTLMLLREQHIGKSVDRISKVHILCSESGKQRIILMDQESQEASIFPSSLRSSRKNEAIHKLGY